MAQTMAELVASGREAMAENDWARAYDLLRRAGAAGDLDPSALDDLALSAWWSGRPDECIDSREQAFAGFLQNGEPLKAALVALDLAESHFHKQATALGYGWVRKAERLLGERPESVEHGWLARMRAVIAFEGENELEAASDMADQAYDIGVRFGDPNLQAISLHDRGRIIVARGEVEAGMALMDEAMVAAIGGELSPFYTGKIYCNMIDICEQLADYRRAGDWSDAARRWCERSGHSSGFPGVCRIHRAEIMRLRGEWREAEEEARKASSELGNFMEFAGEAMYEIGEIRMHMGDLEQAESAFRQANGLGRDPEPGMAELEFIKGNNEGAWTLVSQSLANAGAPLKRAPLLPILVKIAVARGDIEVAREAVDELSAVAAEYETPVLNARASDGRGLLAIAENHTGSAIEHLRSAANIWRTNDLPYLAARSRAMLAEAYLQNGSRESAQLELEAALAVFEKLGATLDARSARAALQHQAKRPVAPSRVATALMFTDIVDSTPLIGVIGDSAWEQLLGWHHRTLRSLFAAHGGREVENTGDGFFAAFDTSTAALECAIEIQRRLATQRHDHGFAPMVRIGLHLGEVTEMGDTLAGEDVHRAARICALAGADEILASAAFASDAQPSGEAADTRLATLKGFPGETELVSIPTTGP